MSTYASHFGINNIPYGIATSKIRLSRQCVTRVEDEVIFLGDLADKGVFKGISAPLAKFFGERNLNAFAALSKEIHSQVRSVLQRVYSQKEYQGCSEPIKNVTLHLPVQIGDFTDFSASKDHLLNASEAIIGNRALPPAFFKYPAVYAGRSSSVRVSGTPVTRPHGQFIEDYTVPEKRIIFGACRALDYELEVGAVIGRPVQAGQMLKAADADQHIFGLVLVNDWSARDIQALEMRPLGPFNSKNFATSISPWIITLEALEKYKVPAPPRMEPVAEFMDDKNSSNYAINLEVEIVRDKARTTTCKVGFDTMYWTFRHMLAHHTVGGCELRTGDLVASGTVSGQGEDEHGCLLEQTKNGKKPKTLSNGGELRYLQDGDKVRFTGVVGAPSDGIGFGECVGIVQPARELVQEAIRTQLSINIDIPTDFVFSFLKLNACGSASLHIFSICSQRAFTT
ncbi:fumarylacetoacetate hydrolase FahA [Lindgomyces ingoldianus]|uniref:Fumarylacetoacetate hydrolase FahA n=1 Tax=Lindgomyces ingoldianus TaxID=673940 RepID=A0ACB6QFU6_9PLEO|nr:fumarylacetoacetate hydrolase FahA [Lindgomyces ingoldianus]KAF2465237.1 fumarylacetoacetate hydrolase FahA [Lindgomyces ingoldianus]